MLLLCPWESDAVPSGKGEAGPGCVPEGGVALVQDLDKVDKAAEEVRLEECLDAVGLDYLLGRWLGAVAVSVGNRASHGLWRQGSREPCNGCGTLHSTA